MTTTSKSLDGVQELTLIAKIKTGIVPCTGVPPSYASRLRLLLTALFAQRKHEMEVDQLGASLLETLSVLRFVRWALLENDTKLMLAVEFDGPWEPYIRQIVTEAGPVLDVIFCHCEEYAGNSCEDGYEKFAAWVRARQVDIPFIYASDPELTVDDMRYLKNYERAQAAGSSLFAQAGVAYPPSNAPLTRLSALFTLRQFFSNDGAVQGAARPITDEAYFDRVSGLIVSADVPNLMAYLGRLKGVSERLSLHDRALAAWAMSLPAQMVAFKAQQAPNVAPGELLNEATVQGNILTSYGEQQLSHGCFALVRFKSATGGASFLKHIAPHITRETSPKRPQDVKINIALTFTGLRTLGLSDAELARFPKEFQEGLEARAGLLGDVGLNHPEHWDLPKYNWHDDEHSDPLPLSLVDAVLILQTQDAEQSHELLQRLGAELRRIEREASERGAELEILHVQATRRYDEKGHLRALDGVSQPVFTTAKVVPAPFADRDRVPLGELLLGYANQTNELGALPPELRDNSTFLAIRKMTQEPQMYDILREQNKLTLALGRGYEGENPITNQKSNDFEFGANSDQQCPLFSHVRRSNPRTPAPRTPRRILRRGMSFGPPFDAKKPDNVERGVMFLAVAANLADQYEVVQRWVNGGNSTGGYSGHPDLIAGTYKPGTDRKLEYRTESGVETITLPPRPAATLRWGLYAFVPSLSALEWLAAYTPSKVMPEVNLHHADKTQPRVTPGPRTQRGAEPLSALGQETKARLEDIFKSDAIHAHVQDVMLNKGGIAVEPEYAVMAAAAPIVQMMLTDPDSYSVRSYWARMKACDATLYLGMDPRPTSLGEQDPYPPFTQEVLPNRYDNESKRANEFAESITFHEAFKVAHAAALNWFKEQSGSYANARQLFAGAPAPIQPAPVLDLQALAARVIRDVAAEIYELPQSLLSDDPDFELPGAPQSPALRCPVDLTSVFAHVFPPRPSSTVSAVAATRGQSIKEKVAAWYKAQPEQVSASRLIKAVRGAPSPNDADFEERTVIGLLSGFAVPTNGSLVSVLMHLVQSDELWRLQRALRDIQIENEGASELRDNLAPITARIYALMMSGPVPSMIHRTAMKAATFPTPLGNVELAPGDLVALQLGGAAASAAAMGAKDPWKYLFGDVPEKEYDPKRPPVHACPGQEMAFGVIHGTLVALLQQPRLKKVPLSSLVLTQYPPNDHSVPAE